MAGGCCALVFKVKSSPHSEVEVCLELTSTTIESFVRVNSSAFP